MCRYEGGEGGRGREVWRYEGGEGGRERCAGMKEGVVQVCMCVYMYLWRNSSSDKGMYSHPLHPSRVCDMHRRELLERGGSDDNFTTALGVKSSIMNTERTTCALPRYSQS